MEQYLQWQSLCPTVEPYYAVKCNNDPAILQTLALLGTGFDCASRAEMEQVLKLGVSPERIIFANPCKMKSHVEFAREKKVAMMTFDDEHELEKIKKIYPEAKLVLRILPPPTKASLNKSPNVLPDNNKIGRNGIPMTRQGEPNIKIHLSEENRFPEKENIVHT